MTRKEAARAIYDAAVRSVMPEELIPSVCRLDGDILSIQEHTFDLREYNNLYLFGSGKAAVTMAKAMERLLGTRITGGLVVAPHCSSELHHVQCIEGTHPLPSQKSIDAAKALKAAMRRCREGDLFIYLLSGGTSALIEEPMEPITLEAFQECTALMLRHDLSIHEINTVRKHISAIKGGRLAQTTKAKGIVLVISDVIGDDLHSIGSAPLYCDRSSYRDAFDILTRHALYEKMPLSVQQVIQGGMDTITPETPKSPPPNMEHLIIGSNQIALKNAARRAETLGFSTRIVSEPMQGNADATGKSILDEARHAEEDCLLYGGETTVEVKGSGTGGRNQQLCLSALTALKTDERITLLCAGSDGIDGNSEAAGAVMGPETEKAAREQGLEPQAYLDDNDATAFFERTGDLVVTGPTGTNVMDIAIIIKGE